MSKPASTSGADELSARDLELIDRARRQRQSDVVPGAARARLLARALDEVKRAAPNAVVPAEQWVALPPRGVGFAMGWAAAIALGVLGLTQLRAVLGGAAESASTAGGPGSSGATGTRQIGDRLFQSALFHAPALGLSGAWPPPETNLFGERPFAPESRAWQVRQWADLTTEPGATAAYEFVGGALCVGLGGGERVIGGWPWVEKKSAAATARGASGAAPAEVRLAAGTSYRLAFKAWAREPLPAQVLIAVGHQRVPFSAAAGARVPVSSQPEPFVVNFVAVHDDPSIGVAFFAAAAAGSERTRLCLSDIHLSEGKPLITQP